MDKKYLVKVYFKNDFEFDDNNNAKLINDEPIIEFRTNEFNYIEELKDENISKYVKTNVSFSFKYHYYNNAIVQMKKQLALDNMVILVAEITDTYLDEYGDICTYSAKPRIFSSLVCKGLKDENDVITYVGEINSLNHMYSFNGNLGDEKIYEKYKVWLLNKLNNLLNINNY